VFDNDNLQDTWDFTASTTNLTIENGVVFFQYNPKLCARKIYELLQVTSLTDQVDTIDVSPTTNGDGMACTSKSLLLTRYTIYCSLLDEYFRVRPNFVSVFVFGAENANFRWFRSLSFSAENDVAFSFSVSFSVETQNGNTEIH